MSVGSIFNSRARALSQIATKVVDSHSHMNYMKSFTTIDSKEHKRNPMAERFPIVTPFYVNGDSVHMNKHGYKALSEVVAWAMAADRAAGEVHEFEEQGWLVQARSKF